MPLGVQVVAQAEWDRRHSVFAADALAWALHAAGRDAEALLMITVGLGLALRNLDGPV